MSLKSFEWFIGLRYLRAKRAQHFISVITFFSMGGIALGVAALIVVLAVMTGFKEELQKQILGVTSHVVVQGFGGQMHDYEKIYDHVVKQSEVLAAAPFILGQVMLMHAGHAEGIVTRGIDVVRERHVSSLAQNLTTGKIEDLKGFGVIIGVHLAANLGVRLGDKVTMMVPVGNVTAAGTMPRMKRFDVVGIFEAGMHEYDSSLAYIALEDAQTLFRMEAAVTGVEMKLYDPEQAFVVRKRLQEHYSGSFWIRDWMQMNHNFFRALKIEKATMFVILFLVVLVAAFNIISSLVMVVMEKGKEIAILMTMGAKRGSIIAIFIINGAVVGVFGTLLGVGLGLLLSFNLEASIGFIEKIFGIKIMSGEVYFIDHLPAVVEPFDVYWIATISLLLSLAATLYPAWRAAQVDPVEALRYG